MIETIQNNKHKTLAMQLNQFKYKMNKYLQGAFEFS